MTEAEKAGLRILDIDDPAGGLLAYSMHKGEIDEALLGSLYKRFDDASAAGAKLRVYAEMEGIPAMEATMFLDKFKRLGTILSTVERMAIVGDAGWLDLYARIVDPITKPAIKHFTSEQRDEALAWIA